MATLSQHFAQRKRESAPRAKEEGSKGQSSLSRPETKGLAVQLTPQEQEELRLFDLDMTYGPCVGMSRKERWERAQSFGLQPPQRILDLLQMLAASDPQHECLWHGRV